MLPEVRMARIIDAIGLHQAKKLSCVEAAELLGMSERHFRRLRDAYEERGAEGLMVWTPPTASACQSGGVIPSRSLVDSWADSLAGIGMSHGGDHLSGGRHGC